MCTPFNMFELFLNLGANRLFLQGNTSLTLTCFMLCCPYRKEDCQLNQMKPNKMMIAFEYYCFLIMIIVVAPESAHGRFAAGWLRFFYK